MRLGQVIFALLAVVVLARLMALEWTYGDGYRAEAARPLQRKLRLSAPRGRILARDGTVLAHDQPRMALAVQYRYLEQPADSRWLRNMARSRLPRPQRRQTELVQAEELRLLAERDELHQSLVVLCGLTPAEFQRRSQEIQEKVSRISQRVNQRRQDSFATQRAEAAARRDESESESLPRLQRWGTWIAQTWREASQEPPPQHIVVAEELDDHVLATDVSLDVVAEVEANPQRYPGVRIVEQSRRIYPGVMLAAHVLGHLGPADSTERTVGETNELVGRLGIEKQFERLLHGEPGAAVDELDHSGRRLQTVRQREPIPGRDLALTLDPALQRTAESLLASALERRVSTTEEGDSAAGGAIVVLDVRNGSVLAAVSAPRFDPNWFVQSSRPELNQAFADPGRPMFDRVAKMAIPPGSVFKALTAIALVESGTVEPHETFFCQGYLEHPDRHRCMIYRRHGQGHGATDLFAALGRSCNVYFFHYAAQMGEQPLVDWTQRFGFGQRTGIDQPDEAAGFVPTPENLTAGRNEANVRWKKSDTQALAIGQHRLTTTPLQVARMMAAVANGGKLVTPHMARGVGLTESGAEGNGSAATIEGLIREHTPRPIEGLHPETLAAVRRGLEQVVADPEGTAHSTVYLESISIAGKTGTAETGNGSADHAWFAGYAPAGSPKVAFVVVLEHAGGGGESAGPVARRLVQRMQKLGYFGKVASRD
jgi:penicillin-binding protein 2